MWIVNTKGVAVLLENAKKIFIYETTDQEKNDIGVIVSEDLRGSIHKEIDLQI